ncbi:diacylglycerol kinase family lipid kinase [Myxococcota bacterium]|nr:diacylglycerol kinase family lipid kinase [Myxococcota bacterium]
MRTLAIVNPTAAGGKAQRRWERMHAEFEDAWGSIENRFTTARGDATKMAREAVEEGFERIIAVGGDGTANEVLNGLFKTPVSDSLVDIQAGAELVIVPLGTGQDFTRTLGSNGRVLSSHEIKNWSPQKVDVGFLETARDMSDINADNGAQKKVRFFMNAASLGVSAHIVNVVNSSNKKMNGRLEFFLGAIKGFLLHRAASLSITIDGKKQEPQFLDTLVAANGRYFGGGMHVAPNALINDGLFDIVTVKGIGTLKFLRYSPLLYAGKHARLKEVDIFRASDLLINKTSPADHVYVECDGEVAGELPARLRIIPGAVRLWS